MLPERAHRWFWFSGVGSIAPLLILSVILLTRDRWVGFPALISRGELFLISAVLLATAIGDLLMSNTRMKKTKLFVGALALGLGGVSAVWYAVIQDCVVCGETYNPNPIIWCSPFIFVFTLIAGLACVMLSSEERRHP
jgi:uncharacterized membrane protein YhhN